MKAVSVLALLLLLLASVPARPAPAATEEGREDDLEEFVPTERISADKPISFPVDI